jgi:hypothetical protein
VDLKVEQSDELQHWVLQHGWVEFDLVQSIAAILNFLKSQFSKNVAEIFQGLGLE